MIRVKLKYMVTGHQFDTLTYLIHLNQDSITDQELENCLVQFGRELKMVHDINVIAINGMNPTTSEEKLRVLAMTHKVKAYDNFCEWYKAYKADQPKVSHGHFFNCVNDCISISVRKISFDKVVDDNEI